MGKEFEIESLEDMCSLMCDNYIPNKPKKLCDTCIYGNKYEYEKPCIVYKPNCELYQKEGE